MLPPYKIEKDEPRITAQMFAGRQTGEARSNDPDQRLVEHWQRLFAERRSGKTGSA
jgi:hypothetical protein